LLNQVRGRDGRRADALARSASLDSNQPPSDNLYTDVPGTRLEPFFIETLGKSGQDRTFLLRLEQDLTDYVHSGRYAQRDRTSSVFLCCRLSSTCRTALLAAVRRSQLLPDGLELSRILSGIQ